MNFVESYFIITNVFFNDNIYPYLLYNKPIKLQYSDEKCNIRFIEVPLVNGNQFLVSSFSSCFVSVS